MLPLFYFMSPAKVFHGIGSCVALLYFRIMNQQSELTTASPKYF